MSLQRSKAFTLVELLVVIGIIAVLISILLPSLNAARKQAKNVQCQSNLRQLMTVTHIYITEHKGTFPAGINYWYDYPGAVRWQGNWWNYPQNPKDYPNPFPTAGKLVPDWEWNNNNVPSFVQDYLAQYLPFPNGKDGNPVVQNPAWNCPEGIPGSAGNTWIYESINTQYRYNTRWAAGRKSSAMSKSSEAMVYYDVCWPDWKPTQYPHNPTRPDKASINVVYGDGHVDSATYKQLIAGNWLPGVDEGDSNLYKTGWRP